MVATLKQRWREFRQGKPGKRFQDYHERRHQGGSSLMRALRLGLGVLLLLVGLVLMPAPGPGMVVVAFAAVMVAGESLIAARCFDGIELRVRALLRRIRG
jgi:hypothetical protein